MNKNEPRYPQLNRDTRLRREFFGGMMYIPKENSLIGNLRKLNRSFFAIAEQCTGAQSVEEMCTLLQKQGADTEKAEKWVESAVEQLMKEGALTAKTEPSIQERPYVLGRSEGDASRITHLSAPLYLGWEITYTCNLNCKHCYNVSGERGEWEPSLEDMKRFADSFAEAGVFGVNIGGGEPLLREDVIDIIAYADQRGLRTNIDTNATQVTDEGAQQLKKAGLRAVHVSIDGSTPAIHDEFRETAGALEQTIEGIKRLQKVGFSPVVRTVVNKLNIDDLKQIDDLLLKLNIHYHVLTRFLPLGRGRAYKNNLMTTPQENKKALEYVVKRRAELVKRKYYLSVDETYPMTVEHLQLTQTPIVQGVCPAGVAICMVATDGSVIPCPYFRDHVIGNMRERPFKEIWDDPFLDKFRKDAAPYQCVTCPSYKTKCAGGCRGFAYIETGDMLNADPGCWMLPQVDIQ